MSTFTLVIGFLMMLGLMLLSVPVAVSIIAIAGIGGYLSMGPSMLDLWGCNVGHVKQLSDDGHTAFYVVG